MGGLLPSPSATLTLALLAASCLCVSGGPQFDTWLGKIIAEKGVDQYANAMEGKSKDNINDFHFPKKSPAAKIVWKEKTHQNRYRNYKQPPKHPMIHTLKPPSKPATLSATAHLDKGKPYDGCLELHWTPPKHDGGTSVTCYEWSRDAGVNWKPVGLSNRTKVEGLRLHENYEFCIRAVNKIGPGAWNKMSLTNTIPEHINVRLGVRDKADALRVEQKDGTTEIMEELQKEVEAEEAAEKARAEAKAANPEPEEEVKEEAKQEEEEKEEPAGEEEKEEEEEAAGDDEEMPEEDEEEEE